MKATPTVSAEEEDFSRRSRWWADRVAGGCNQEGVPPKRWVRICNREGAPPDGGCGICGEIL